MTVFASLFGFLVAQLEYVNFEKWQWTTKANRFPREDVSNGPIRSIPSF